MDDFSNYQIQIDGQVHENELNTLSPLEIRAEKVDADSRWLSVLTDQSGLIGLMRYLHGLGCVFLFVNRKE